MDKVSTEELFKEIDLIQACIERMAKNSFMVKGWAMTIFVGALTLLKGDVFSYPWLIIIAVIIPYLAFWYLDAYFLRTEKCYRLLYEWVIEKRADSIKTSQFDLNPCRFKEQSGKFYKTFFSQTLIVFFGTPTIILTILCIVSIIKSFLYHCVCK